MKDNFQTTASLLIGSKPTQRALDWWVRCAFSSVFGGVKLFPVAYALLGLALVFVAYLFAGGQDRLMPFYGFPEPAYGCNFNDVGVLSSEPAPELSRGYLQDELLKCYPPQYYLLYALAIFGLIVSIFALIIRGIKIFQRQ